MFSNLSNNINTVCVEHTNIYIYLYKSKIYKLYYNFNYKQIM